MITPERITAARMKAREAVVERVRNCEHGNYHQVYGVFHGGDPRLFEPDLENTAEELDAHRAACEAWDRGEKVDRGPGCATMGDGSVYDGTGFGMGVSTWPCDDPLIDAALDRLVVLERAEAALKWTDHDGHLEGQMCGACFLEGEVESALSAIEGEG